MVRQFQICLRSSIGGQSSLGKGRSVSANKLREYSKAKVLIEQPLSKRGVVGSSPAAGSISFGGDNSLAISLGSSPSSPAILPSGRKSTQKAYESDIQVICEVVGFQKLKIDRFKSCYDRFLSRREYETKHHEIASKVTWSSLVIWVRIPSRQKFAPIAQRLERPRLALEGQWFKSISEHQFQNNN
jgi:hypothetical protein